MPDPKETSMADVEAMIERLRDLAARITPVRPGWNLRVKDDGEERYELIGDPCGFPVATFGDHNDAAFDAVCREVVPQLLAALATPQPAEGAGVTEAVDPRPDIVGDPLCKIISYNDIHETAVELGYPSVTEALEHLSEFIEARQQPPLIAVLAEAVHDRLFGVAAHDDPALALKEISDGGGIHEAVHELLRSLPARQQHAPPREPSADVRAAFDKWREQFNASHPVVYADELVWAAFQAGNALATGSGRGAVKC